MRGVVRTYPRLLAAHDQIGMMLRHRGPLTTLSGGGEGRGGESAALSGAASLFPDARNRQERPGLLAHCAALGDGEEQEDERRHPADEHGGHRIFLHPAQERQGQPRKVRAPAPLHFGRVENLPSGPSALACPASEGSSISAKQAALSLHPPSPPRRLTLMKFDPRVNKHVLFKEERIKK